MIWPVRGVYVTVCCCSANSEISKHRISSRYFLSRRVQKKIIRERSPAIQVTEAGTNVHNNVISFVVRN